MEIYVCKANKKRPENIWLFSGFKCKKKVDNWDAFWLRLSRVFICKIITKNEFLDYLGTRIEILKISIKRVEFIYVQNTKIIEIKHTNNK